MNTVVEGLKMGAEVFFAFLGFGLTIFALGMIVLAIITIAEIVSGRVEKWFKKRKGKHE